MYQPIIDLLDGSVSAVEALLRWRHPVLGDVPAEVTVAAAERIGLSWDLTRWIIGEAATEVVRWSKAHSWHRSLRLGVNFSPLLFEDGACADAVEQELQQAGLAPELFRVELTESALARPSRAVLAGLHQLRSRGVLLAMDDFGTGFSSLLSLVDLPFDILKIDRSFIGRLDGTDDKLLPAIAGIARARRLVTVAEGIETLAHLAALMAAGCEYGQGYLFARPLEAGALATLPEVERTSKLTVSEARLSTVGVDPLCGEVRHGRVLVVDDNPVDRKLLRLLLESVGYVVDELADAADLRRAVARRPDLAMLDLRLVQRCAAGEVRDLASSLSMPVLAVTAYPRWIVEAGSWGIRIDGILAKPVDRARLMEEVDALLLRRDGRPGS